MEDCYRGYRIPAGSIVIGNAWLVWILSQNLLGLIVCLLRAIFYDEKMYPAPETFNPDRVMKDGKLDPNVLDPKHVAFGFGRR